MKDREYRDYLNDIADAIADAAAFTEGMTFEDFLADRKTIHAVTRCLEIIGEAANNVPDHVRDMSPEIPWAAIRGMRNRIAHEYFGVDNKVVWETVQRDLPKLKPQIAALIAETMQ